MQKLGKNHAPAGCSAERAYVSEENIRFHQGVPRDALGRSPGKRKGRSRARVLYDRDIREQLFEFLEERYEKVRIIEEKQIGRSRADLMMVLPEAVVGIEIKSDADTYTRLSRQVKDYNRYFDSNYVVAGASHGLHVEEHVPAWWGIITVEETDCGADFYVLRRARPNPALELERKLSLLWRPELAHIQELNQMPRYREKSKRFVIEKLLACVPEACLRRQISQELFERDYTEIAESLRSYREEHGRSPRGSKGKKGSSRKRTVHESGQR